MCFAKYCLKINKSINRFNAQFVGNVLQCKHLAKFKKNIWKCQLYLYGISPPTIFSSHVLECLSYIKVKNKHRSQLFYNNLHQLWTDPTGLSSWLSRPWSWLGWHLERFRFLKAWLDYSHPLSENDPLSHLGIASFSGHKVLHSWSVQCLGSQSHWLWA